MQNRLRTRLLLAVLFVVIWPLAQVLASNPPLGPVWVVTAGAPVGTDQQDEGEDDWDDEDWDEDSPDEDEEVDPERAEAMERASAVGFWGDPVVSSTREWTVLVYLDGDNNLEGAAIVDMLEMQMGMAEIDTDLVDVIVLFDRAKEYEDWCGDWDETRVYRILPSESDEEIESELLHVCGELNMGSPQTLENFIAEGMRMYPAPRTALILWNHGGGWAVLLTDDDAPGSEYGDDSMSIEDVRVALSRAAVHYPDGKLDLLVLDMCLMGQAEVLVAVAPFVKYLVASPPLAPALGMDFKGMMTYFAEGLETSKTAIGVARTACQAFLDYGRKDGTLAVYDLSKVGGLLSSFGSLARKFDTLIPIAWSHLTRSIFYTRNFGGREDLYSRSGTTSSIDILDWLSRLQAISDPMLAREFSAEIEAVRKALADVIVYEESGPSITNSNGLAVYAPLRSENFDEDYRGNAFGAYTDWAQTLTDLYVEQEDNAGSPPRISSIEFGSLIEKKQRRGKIRTTKIQIEPADVISVGAEDADADDRFVKLTVNGTNILWVIAGFAISHDDNPDSAYLPVLMRTILNSQIIVPAEEAAKMTAADDEIPVFRDGRNEFIYELTPYLTGLSNGEDTAIVYPQYLDAGNTASARILGQFRRAAEEEWSMAIVNTEDREIISVDTWMEYDDGDSPVTSILPGAEDWFRPLYKYYNEDGDVVTEFGDAITWGHHPSLVRSWPPEGRYIKIMCLAESLAGEGSLLFSDPIKVGALPEAVADTFDHTYKDDQSNDD